MNSLFNSFDNIIIFDIETTGLNFKHDEIIEIAMLQAVNKQNQPAIADEFDLYVKLSPGKMLPKKITELTGITQQMLDDEGVSKEETCDRIADMLACPNILLIAYNAQFDLSFLYHFLNQFGKAGLLKNIKLLDLLTIYKDRKPYPHKLSDAITAYSISGTNTHRAIDDAKAAYELLCAMGAEEDDLHHYVNLFGYNPRYGISGSKISSVKYLPQGYDARGKLYDT